MAIMKRGGVALIGAVAMLGLVGCQCAGQQGQRKPRGAKVSRGPAGPDNGPAYAYQSEDLILDRLDRMQMDMDARFSGLQNDVNDLRNRPYTAPQTTVVEYTPAPVAAPAVDVYASAPYDDGQIIFTNEPLPPRMEPVVQRTPLSAARPTGGANLAKHHLRVPGVTVLQLQRALKEADFNPGKLDGVMGKRTIDAIREFQAYHKLKVDGIVGRNTWAMLQRMTATAGPGGPIPPK